MGVVIGPFDKDDWYTMGQLKLDLGMARKLVKENPSLFEEAASIIQKKLKGYMTREAA